jgi:hypothetical protein
MKAERRRRRRAADHLRASPDKRLKHPVDLVAPLLADPADHPRADLVDLRLVALVDLRLVALVDLRLAYPVDLARQLADPRLEFPAVK